MIVFPVIRLVGLKATTASPRGATVPMFVRSPWLGTHLRERHSAPAHLPRRDRLESFAKTHRWANTIRRDGRNTSGCAYRRRPFGSWMTRCGRPRTIDSRDLGSSRKVARRSDHSASSRRGIPVPPVWLCALRGRVGRVSIRSAAVTGILGDLSLLTPPTGKLPTHRHGVWLTTK